MYTYWDGYAYVKCTYKRKGQVLRMKEFEKPLPPILIWNETYPNLVKKYFKILLSH